MGRAQPSPGQGGFTLVELLIALVLLVLALTISAQLLEETAQLFAESSAEALDTPVPLVIARIRGDVQGAAGAYPILDEKGSLVRVVIQYPGSRILYEKEGETLYRTVVPDLGDPEKPGILWRGVRDWACIEIPGTRLVDLSVTYRRRAAPRSPLPSLPIDRGPRSEELTQRLFLLPRGAGLGVTW